MCLDPIRAYKQDDKLATPNYQFEKRQKELAKKKKKEEKLKRKPRKDEVQPAADPDRLPEAGETTPK